MQPKNSASESEDINYPEHVLLHTSMDGLENNSLNGSNAIPNSRAFVSCSALSLSELEENTVTKLMRLLQNPILAPDIEQIYTDLSKKVEKQEQLSKAEKLVNSLLVKDDANALIQLCTSFKAKITNWDVKGMNFVQYCAKYPRPKALEAYFIYMGRSLINDVGKIGETPLYIAAKHGNSKIVKKLVKTTNSSVKEIANLVVTTCTTNKETPLFAAVANAPTTSSSKHKEYIDTISLLLSSYTLSKQIINAATVDGRTPLIEATMNENLPVVRILIMRGAHPLINVRDKTSGTFFGKERSALSEAMKTNNADLIDCLQNPERMRFLIFVNLSNYAQSITSTKAGLQNDAMQRLHALQKHNHEHIKKELLRQSMELQTTNMPTLGILTSKEQATYNGSLTHTFLVAVKYIYCKNEKEEEVINNIESMLCLPIHNNIVRTITFYKITSLSNKLEFVQLIQHRNSGPSLSTAIFNASHSTQFNKIEIKLKWITEICEGLHTLHTNGVVHGNLQPGAIILNKNKDGDYSCKIQSIGRCDLSCLKKLPTGEEVYCFQKVPKSLCYSAPEELQHDYEASTFADIFNLGTLMWCIVALEEPFSGLPSIQVQRHLLAGDRLKIPADQPELIKVLITLCWQQSPDKRIMLQDMLSLLHSDKTLNAIKAVYNYRPNTYR